MAKYSPADIATGFYADDALPWSAQDCANWLPAAAEQKGTRTAVMMKTPPGLSPLIEFSAVAQPMRGLYVAENRLFAVQNGNLYQVQNDGQITTLGAIPGTSRVRFAHNKIDQGNQVLAVNGSSGYVWNTADETFIKITDAGYPGAIDAVFIDGYLIQIEPGRRFAFHSDLSDALAYNTLDRFTSEVSPDALVAMAVANNELLLLSETTGEFFYNSGATQQPFRSKRTSFDKGCAGRFAIATLGSTVFWLGNDGMFYALNGYSPQRISNRPVEQAIRDLNWSQAYAFIWETEGHSVIYWTFPDGYTFGYDVSQPPGLQWHRRVSFGLERWRVFETAYWRNDWVAADFQKGRLWSIDWGYAPLEGDEAFTSELVGGVIHDNQNTVFMPYAEFLFKTGEEETAVRPFFNLAIQGDLGNGPQGEGVNFQYTSTGGWLPHTFSITGGALPAGLSMNSAGLVTGTRTTVGVYTWEVTVTDAYGFTASLDDTSETTSAEIFFWNVYPLATSQDVTSAFIFGDIAAMTGNGSVINYAFNRGQTWASVATPVSVLGYGIVRFNGDWYVFGDFGGAKRMIKSAGDTFTTLTDLSASIPFVPSRSGGDNGTNAYLIGSLLYVSEEVTAPSNFKLHHCTSPIGTWTPLDTGIAVIGAGQGLSSYCEAGGFHIFGTTDGRVLRSADLVTFAVVHTFSTAVEVQVASLGSTVLAAHDDGLSRSTDNGATFAAPYVQGIKVLANGFHFITATGVKIFTSTTGASGTWTERFDGVTGALVRGHGYATDDLAMFGSFASGARAYVGDVA